MARRRPRFQGASRAQAQAQKAARKVKIPLPPKPDVKALKSTLEQIVSASIEIRVRALGGIVGWYDEAVKYLIAKGGQDPVLAKQLQDKIQRLTRANKAWELGVNTAAGLPEKEQALRTAVFQFELYCNPTMPDAEVKRIEAIKDKAAAAKADLEWKSANWAWPMLAVYYKKYEESKVMLEAKEKAAGAKYGELLESLGQAFQNVPVKFKVTNEVQGRKYDGAGTMLYGMDVARIMVKTLKKEGILKLMINELIPVTTIMALAQDANGNPVKDAKVQVGAIDSVLKGFVAYCQSDAGPAKILRKGVPVAPLPQGQPAAGNGATKPPRAPKQPGAGKNLVGGRYRSGSAIATLYSRMADGKEHTKQELFAGLGSCEGGHDAPFTRLLRHVGLFSEFTIAVNGDKVTMTLKGGN